MNPTTGVPLRKAKELLGGEAEIEGGFHEWLGEPVEAVVDEEDKTEEARPKSAERYTPSNIEQITPKMRQELIVRLLVKGMERIGLQ